MRDPFQKKRSIWKIIVALTLCVGYAGFYVCRSDLSVASPTIRDELKIGNSELGLLASCSRCVTTKPPLSLTHSIAKAFCLLETSMLLIFFPPRNEGIVLTAGTAAYAVGKFISGPVIDFLGGRRVRKTTCCFKSNNEDV